MSSSFDISQLSVTDPRIKTVTSLREEHLTVLCQLRDIRRSISTAPERKLFHNDYRHDLDDATALSMSICLHKLGTIELALVSACFGYQSLAVEGETSEEKDYRISQDKFYRAQCVRGALDSVNLPSVPVCYGSKEQEKHPEFGTYHITVTHPYEHNDPLRATGTRGIIPPFNPEFAKVLSNGPLGIISLAGQQTFREFIESSDGHMWNKENILNLYSQGGIKLMSGIAFPSMDASNNLFSPLGAAVTTVTTQSRGIPLEAHHKEGAYSINSISGGHYLDLENSGHPLDGILAYLASKVPQKFYECSRYPETQVRNFRWQPIISGFDIDQELKTYFLSRENGPDWDKIKPYYPMLQYDSVVTAASLGDPYTGPIKFYDQEGKGITGPPNCRNVGRTDEDGVMHGGLNVEVVEKIIKATTKATGLMANTENALKAAGQTSGYATVGKYRLEATQKISGEWDWDVTVADTSIKAKPSESDFEPHRTHDDDSLVLIRGNPEIEVTSAEATYDEVKAGAEGGSERNQSWRSLA